MTHARIAALALVAMATAGCNRQSMDDKVQAYRRQQASDLLADYEHARSGHNLIAQCVKANQVSAAYRDASDPADADAWKAKAAEDCRLAGAQIAPPH